MINSADTAISSEVKTEDQEFCGPRLDEIGPRLIHAWPQSSIFTDGKTFMTTGREIAEIKSKGDYFLSDFPHTGWEAMDLSKK